MSAAPGVAAEPGACFHCGESLDTPEAVFDRVGGAVRGFCCHGCLGAAELIYELGLSEYYARRDPRDGSAPPLAPKPVADLARFDDAGLQRGFVTESPDGERTASLSVAGMRCAACSWLLEERLSRVPGVSEARFGLASGRGRVRWDPSAVRLSDILARVAELGYRAVPWEPDTEEALIRAERRAALRRLGVAGLGTMQVMMFSVALYAGAFSDLETVHRDLLRVASGIIATPVLFWAGWPFLSGAWRDVRTWRVGPDVPIALALLGAYLSSAVSTATGTGEVWFDSVCMFVFFITLGRTLERDLRARAELRVRTLQKRVPRIAHRLAGGREVDVPAADLRAGDVLAVHPGETVPADGLVTDGRGDVSEALLTGEASPVAKQPGSVLVAGSENFDGELRMRVERVGAASTLQQIASLLDRAQLEKSPVAELASRIARVFVGAVVVAALAVGLAWWWIDPGRVVPVVLSVLIATCPCALSLATPAALAAATHGLAACGLLVTRGHALEALARVSRVVFDKTGTLTEPVPVLRDVVVVRDGLDRDEALRWAVALEAGSHHPVARALRGAHPVRRAEAAAADAWVEAGAGVGGKVDGRLLRLGRPDWSAAPSGARIAAPRETGDAPGSFVLLADERGPLAWFELATLPRSGAGRVVAWLERAGIRVTLLSGDPSRRGVDAIADRLGVADARAGASPEAKVAAVEEWIAEGETVMAVGDGVNDAPLLGRAQVSLAMGSGSDLARLRADAVLLDDRLDTIPLALTWARRARRVMHQNFAWALAYNLSVLPLAAVGWLPPWLAALGMSFSSLLVVSNSLRLRRAPRTETVA